MKHLNTAFLLVFITFIVHLTYINNDFVWLDHLDIENRAALLPVQRLLTAFTKPYAATNFYRPLVTISLSLDSVIFGNWAPGFHLTNVFLYSLLVITTYYFCLHVFKESRNIARLAGLIVALHPVSWLPVGAIAYRPEILAVLFTLLTLIFHSLSKHHSPSIKYQALSCLSLALAFFSKESTLWWFPALLLLTDIYTHKTSQTKTPTSVYISESLTYLGLIALRFIVISHGWSGTVYPLPISTSMTTRIWSIGKLLSYLILPLKPALSDATPIVSLFHPLVLTTLLGLVLVYWILRTQGTKYSLPFFCVLVGLTPALNLIYLPRFTSSHYALIALPFTAILGSRLYHRYHASLLIRIAGITYLVIASASTFTAGSNFQSDTTLFTPELRRDPHFKEAHYYLGNVAFYQTHDYITAKFHYLKALSSDPGYISFIDDVATRQNLAGVYLAQKDVAPAQLLLHELNQESPSEINAYNYALAFFQQSDCSRVIELLAPYQPNPNSPYTGSLYTECLSKQQP